MTQEKQESATQYEDTLEGDELRWEGEAGHQNDERIGHAGDNGDEIHIFFRERHHQRFAYLGVGRVEHFRLLAHKPSEFVFVIEDLQRVGGAQSAGS